MGNNMSEPKSTDNNTYPRLSREERLAAENIMQGRMLTVSSRSGRARGQPTDMEDTPTVTPEPRHSSTQVNSNNTSPSVSRDSTVVAEGGIMEKQILGSQSQQIHYAPSNIVNIVDHSQDSLTEGGFSIDNHYIESPHVGPGNPIGQTEKDANETLEEKLGKLDSRAETFEEKFGEQPNWQAMLFQQEMDLQVEVELIRSQAKKKRDGNTISKCYDIERRIKGAVLKWRNMAMSQPVLDKPLNPPSHTLSIPSCSDNTLLNNMPRGINSSSLPDLNFHLEPTLPLVSGTQTGYAIPTPIIQLNNGNEHDVGGPEDILGESDSARFIPYNTYPRRRSLQDEIQEVDGERGDEGINEPDDTGRSDNESSEDSDLDLTRYDREGDLPTIKFIFEDLLRVRPKSSKELEPSARFIIKKVIQMEEKLTNVDDRQTSVTKINEGIINMAKNNEASIKDLQSTVNQACASAETAVTTATTVSSSLKNHERTQKESIVSMLSSQSEAINNNFQHLRKQIVTLQTTNSRLSAEMKFLTNKVNETLSTNTSAIHLEDLSLRVQPPLVEAQRPQSGSPIPIPGITRNSHSGVTIAACVDNELQSNLHTSVPPAGQSSPHVEQSFGPNATNRTLDYDTIISRDLLKENFVILIKKLERMTSKRVTTESTHDQVQENLQTRVPQVEKASKQCSETFIKYSGYPDRDYVLCKRAIRVMSDAADWVADIRDIADDRESYSQPITKDIRDLKPFSNDANLNIFEFFKRFESQYGRKGTDKQRGEILVEKFLAPRIALLVSDYNHDYIRIKSFLETKYGDVVTITSTILDDLESTKKPSPNSSIKTISTYMTSVLSGMYRLTGLSNTPGINVNELDLCIYSRSFLRRIRELLPEDHIMRLDRRASDKGFDPERITGEDGFKMITSYINRELIGMDHIAKDNSKRNAEQPTNPDKARSKRSPKRANMVTLKPSTPSSSTEDEGDEGTVNHVRPPNKGTRNKKKGQTKPPEKWQNENLKFPCPMENHNHELGTCESFLSIEGSARLKHSKRKLCFTCLGPWSRCFPKCTNSAKVPKELLCRECLDNSKSSLKDPFSVLLCYFTDHTKPMPKDISHHMKKWFAGFDPNSKLTLSVNHLIAGFMQSCHQCGTSDRCSCHFQTKSSSFDPFASVPVVDTHTGEDISVSDGSIVRETSEATIFVMQWLKVRGKEFLTFYDRGASQHLINGAMAEEINLKVVNSRPSKLTVVGGSSISTDYGLYRMALGKTPQGKVHELVCQGMTSITGTFPRFNLQEVNSDLKRHKNKAIQPSEQLPAEVGGSEVHLLLGIKDTELEPALIFTLPNGLGVYRSKLKDKFGSSICYGGPHKSFTKIIEMTGAHVSNFMVMFTNSYKNSLYNLIRDESESIETNKDEIVIPNHATSKGITYSMEADSELECRVFPTPLTELDFYESGCSVPKDLFDNFEGMSLTTPHTDGLDQEPSKRYHHCPVLKAKVPLSRLKEILDQSDIDDPVTYRCPDCAKCLRCKQSSKIRAISLNNAIDQEFLEKTTHIDIENKRVCVDFPFLKEPTEFLTKMHGDSSNMAQAISVYKTQCKKSPEIKEGIRKAHQGLVENGFMVLLSSLPEDIQQFISLSLFQHFSPWRCHYKPDSKSTSVRIVIDPTMSGLNMILPKGENKMGNIVSILLRARCKKYLWTSDISKFYNQLKLNEGSYPFSLFLYHDSLDPSTKPDTWVMTSAWYGQQSAGGQADVAVEKIADIAQEALPLSQEPLREDRYVDDISGTNETEEEQESQIEQTMQALEIGGLKTKYVVRSGHPPPTEASLDGEGVRFLGYYWEPVLDVLRPGFQELNFNKRIRGARKPNQQPVLSKDQAEELMKNEIITRKVVVAKVGELFDPVGFWEPYKLQLKLDVSLLNGLDWKTPLTSELQEHWKKRFLEFTDIPSMEISRCVLPPGTPPHTKVRLLCVSDAAVHAGGAAVYVGARMSDGNYSCTLLAAKSRILDGTVPRNELSAIMLMTELAYTVKKALGDLVEDIMYVTDSTIAMCWIFNENKKLRHYVLNRVTLIRQMIEWTSGHTDKIPLYHIEGELNIADLLTKPHPITPKDLSISSEWQSGYAWMGLPFNMMPLMSYTDLRIKAKELQDFEKECFQEPFVPISNPLIHGLFGCNPVQAPANTHCTGCSYVSGSVSWECYGRSDEYDHCDQCGCNLVFNVVCPGRVSGPSHSTVDILRLGWQKGIRIMSLCLRVKHSIIHRAHGKTANSLLEKKWKAICMVCNSAEDHLEKALINEAELEFYRQDSKILITKLTSKRMKQFSMDKGIIWYTGRILELNSIKTRDLDTSCFFDNNEIKDTVPVLNSDSPVFYALVIYIHTYLRPHSGVEVTLREVSKRVHVLNNPRRIIQRVRKDCTRCRIIFKKTMELEMAQHHQARTTLAPPFYNCMADIAYGFKAKPYPEARKEYKLYALVIVCVLTSATSILAIEGLATQNVIQALERHSSRYGVPNRIFVDNGTQLIALQNTEFSLRDVNLHVYDSMGLTVEVSTAKAHESRGRVEAKVKILRSMLDKMAVNTSSAMTAIQWDTCFGMIANQIDDLPMAKGNSSNVSDLGWEIITPNRLKLGRNNFRSLSGPIKLTGGIGLTELLDKNRKVQQTWYQMLLDRLHHLILKPNKWQHSDIPLVDDIVLFIYLDGQKSKNQAVWKLGRVIRVDPSKRKVIIAFPDRIAADKIPKLRTIGRSLREISVIFSAQEIPINTLEHFQSLSA